MKLGRLAAVACVLGLLASSASAGNGSNFVHYNNGIDWWFYFPPTGPTPGSSYFRCFPGAINHAPTVVVNPADPNVGTYAQKIETLYVSVMNFSGFILLPMVALTSSPGTCAFTSTAGSAVFFNWGAALFSTAAPPVAVGPLNGGGFGAVIAHAAGTIGIPVGTAAGGFQISIGFGGVSAVSIPEGNATTWAIAEKPYGSVAPVGGVYWTGSTDERKVCTFDPTSAYIYAAGTSFFGTYWVIATGYASGWDPSMPSGSYSPYYMVEYGMGYSTVDAVVEVANNPAAIFDPPGPGNHAGYPAPFDLGNNHALSITGTTVHTWTAGETWSLASYDDVNANPGTGVHLSLLNWSGFGAATCARSHSLYNVPTGGPGGAPFGGPLPQAPRSTGQIDSVTTTLLANVLWLGGTLTGIAPANLFQPFWSIPAGMSGHSGNNGGFMIPIPPLPVLIGIEVTAWQWGMGGPGGPIQINAANGHSLTNCFPVQFYP